MATDRYGSQFRWIMLVGDISAMYDEIDILVACDALRQAIHAVCDWSGKRKARCKGANMSYNGGDVKWGKPNRDKRLYVDFEVL